MEFINFELDILKFISSTFRCGFMDAVMTFYTALGEVGLIWLASSIVLLIPKKTRKTGFTALLAIGVGALLTNVVIKNIVARPRPYTYVEWNLIIDEPSEWSFPSGHTTAAIAFATAITLRHKKAWWVYVPAALMAFTRLYLFVHFPTDILGGAAVGVIGGFTANYLTKLIFKDKANG